MAQRTTAGRTTLTRERVLHEAVAMADRDGIESVSMRNLAQALDVVPMALYKHVAGKDELLDGMVDVVVGEIDPPSAATDWRAAVRERILSARRSLLRHRWAAQIIESRTTPTPTVMGYMDSMIGLFRAGGLSIDLTHHVMHTMGSRIFGFTQELFEDSPPPRGDPDVGSGIPPELARAYPHIAEIVQAITHDPESVVGQGCDDQFEFEFALDVLLDGIERLRAREAQAGGAKNSSGIPSGSLKLTPEP